MQGGCSAGRKFANVDAAGGLHACQFWGHESLGKLRDAVLRTLAELGLTRGWAG